MAHLCICQKKSIPISRIKKKKKKKPRKARKKEREKEKALRVDKG